ncbi:MAG: hypothetical protein ACYTAS_22415 [Planctomycetota bacterium]|jgi:hypothetical protein
MSSFNDAVLRQMYIEYDTPCDRLVSNPSILISFARDYANRTGQTAEPAALAHRLLNLRRRGEDAGGLSRLRRRYNGRN